MAGGKLVNAVKGIALIALVFCIPRFFMNGGASLDAVKKWFHPQQTEAVAPPAPAPNGTAKPAGQEPSKEIRIDPATIERKDDVTLPTPETAKLSPVTPIPEILRFDYVPADIVKKWPYVTAANPELYLQAYRAPLITGSASDDLAGVITYFFDLHSIQKISIRAKTGDFRKLVTFLQRHYGFVQRETQSPTVFIYEQPETFSRKDGSHLWIRPNLAFAEGIEEQRFDVTLVLNRPKP
jgi:hypothetical protein